MANGQAEKAEAVRHPPACLIFVFTWDAQSHPRPAQGRQVRSHLGTPPARRLPAPPIRREDREGSAEVQRDSRARPCLGYGRAQAPVRADVVSPMDPRSPSTRSRVQTSVQYSGPLPALHEIL